MIKSTIAAVSKRIETLFSEENMPHKNYVVYKSLTDVDTSRDEKQFVSWIKPETIIPLSDGQNRKNKRLYIDVPLNNDSYERLYIKVCRIDVEWRIDFNGGIDQYFQCIGKFAQVYVDKELSFSLQVQAGNQIVPIDIIVGSDDFGNWPFPELEGDYTDDRPILIMPLSIYHAPIFIKSSIIPTFKNIHIKLITGSFDKIDIIRTNETKIDNWKINDGNLFQSPTALKNTPVIDTNTGEEPLFQNHNSGNKITLANIQEIFTGNIGDALYTGDTSLNNVNELLSENIENPSPENINNNPPNRQLPGLPDKNETISPELYKNIGDS